MIPPSEGGEVCCAWYHWLLYFEDKNFLWLPREGLLCLRRLCAAEARYIILCLKNIPSLTGYSFNTHPPVFLIICCMSSADIQKLTAGITFSTTSLLLTLFCSEVKLRHQRLEAASHWYVGSILQSIIDKAVDQWTARLRACVKANWHYLEYLL